VFIIQHGGMESTPSGEELTPRQQEQLLALRRMKRISTLLLVLVALLYVAARRFEAQYPSLAVLAAFSEAAMVGALADWFAVVALFRHPMGVPLPHTAIIPHNKGRIAENLGAFITGHFLRTEVILQRIAEFNPGARFGQWLCRPASEQGIADYAARALGYGLRAVEDDRLLRFLHGAALARLRDLNLSRLAGHVLEALSRDGRHQQALDLLLRELRIVLAEEGTQQKVAALIAREFEGWRKALLGTVQIDAMIGDYSGKKLVAALVRLLDEVDADRSHPLRLRFDRLLGDFIGKLKTDADFRARGEQLRDDLLARPELAAWLDQGWLRLRAWMERDLADPQSAIRSRLAAAIADLGGRLCKDEAMQAWVNEQVLAVARPLCEEHRERIGRFIADQVKAWDERYMVRQFELNIGADLQYIRINGTLIGGLAGLLIYAATRYIQS
jgi:uncharacterized membrane-anchored protein YjiN (DUF445 family)